MEKNKGTKVIAIIALIVAVISLSLGFALFSATLTIKPSAEVNTDPSVFSVKFSSSSSELLTAQITPSTTNNGVTGDKANISDTTISGLKAHFTKPGQSATYTFYAYNNGDLDGYLKSINFGTVDSGGNKKCTPTTTTSSGSVTSNPASSNLVTEACNGITLTVKVGNGGEEEPAIITAAQTNDSISSHKLTKKKSEKVEVVIEYKQDAQVADGDFDVKFGDITLTYKTAD